MTHNWVSQIYLKLTHQSRGSHPFHKYAEAWPSQPLSLLQSQNLNIVEKPKPNSTVKLWKLCCTYLCKAIGWPRSGRYCFGILAYAHKHNKTIISKQTVQIAKKMGTHKYAYPKNANFPSTHIHRCSMISGILNAHKKTRQNHQH